VQVSHDVVADRVSITERIAELSQVLALRPRLEFEEIFETPSNSFELVITFLALLEMTRLKMTRLFQAEPLGPLFIERGITDPQLELPVHLEGEPQ
jgi:segregation and condensation protein A